ncbi:hypothetical protein G9G63_09950 [Paenibacillus sp. EKM202P]|uniref:phage tail domain-containing protein n=1 Tax=unclassified Paenibacillus TaxID=185978 RepID=UPI0013EAA6DD|nr:MULTISPECIES: phage tail domain-containing protein [unclassified Paenibacillus]KAF6565470.1 hypothetical protein G9G63_09950 [Paenibacillus sp. EKM202P]KAF6569205.1 hypothetical protein G9G64_12145 [Paenibacillus sp. EKM207P]
MATWNSLTNKNGIYTYPTVTIPVVTDGALSKISWNQTMPEGSIIVVQSRKSDDGYNWSEWRNCVNGSEIPEINEDTPLYNTKLSIRVIIQTTDYSIRPFFDPNITLHFQPVLVFHNKGDLPCQPEIWISKVGSGDFTMTNTSHNNEQFKFIGLVDGETVYVNNERQNIETTLAVTYRYKDFNDNYLNLPVGKSVFKVDGDADIKWRYQYKRI